MFIFTGCGESKAYSMPYSSIESVKSAYSFKEVNESNVAKGLLLTIFAWYQSDVSGNSLDLPEHMQHFYAA